MIVRDTMSSRQSFQGRAEFRAIAKRLRDRWKAWQGEAHCTKWRSANRWNDGMNDEAKSHAPKWRTIIPVTVFPIVMLAAYQVVHYATAAVVYEPGFCCGICVHKIGGQRVPEWAEDLFHPADAIDRIVGVDPYREPGG